MTKLIKQAEYIDSYDQFCHVFKLETWIDHDILEIMVELYLCAEGGECYWNMGIFLSHDDFMKCSIRDLVHLKDTIADYLTPAFIHISNLYYYLGDDPEYVRNIAAIYDIIDHEEVCEVIANVLDNPRSIFED